MSAPEANYSFSLTGNIRIKKIRSYYYSIKITKNRDADQTADAILEEFEKLAIGFRVDLLKTCILNFRILLLLIQFFAPNPINNFIYFILSYKYIPIVIR